MPKKFPWNTSLDEILQSDSNVIVEDTGVGTVTINIDGSPVGVFSSTGLVVTGTIGGDVEHLKLSGATKVSAVGEGARITSSAGYLAELTYSGTEFRIESRLHGGTFKLQAESSGGSDRRILNADPDGNLDLYYPKDNVAVLTLTDVTGSGAYGVNMTGVSGNFGTWFFSGPTMAFTNQTAGGGMGFNAKQTGGAFVTGFYFDPDGPSKIVHPATDANILESLATGIIVGDGTVTSETLPITNGDTAQFKVTGNDLDIQVDQASGAINLLSSGAEVMLKATGDAAVALYYDGTVEGETVSGAFKATNGFQIASSGVTIDTIETTLTDDDTHFPTSGAVFDAISGFGAGDVVGPGSATDHAVARFNLATGKLIQNSLMTIDDAGSANIPSGQSYKINNSALVASDIGAAPSSHGNANHSSTFITASGVTYGNLSTNGDIGTGSNQVSQGDHSHGQLHTRLHAMTDILDHSANNWSIFHSNGAGQVIELPLGAANTVLQGNGVGAAPTMAQLTHSQIGTVGEDDHHSRSHSIAGASDHTATNWRIFSSNGAGQITEIALGVDNTYLKSTGASAAPGFEALDISDDASPTLGGDLVLDENSIKYIPGSLADTTAEGEVATMTIDAAADVAFGDLLFMASDFELEQADASASATMPVIAMSLGTGEGSQDVLLRGFVRDDLWNWSAGPIYASIATGLMTQTAPSGSGERVQRVGWAYSADVMFFDPDSTDIGVV